MADPIAEAYDRGVVAGEISARLAGHDAHFARLNGSLTAMAEELHELTLATQRLADQAVARDAAVIGTAAALKAAEIARQEKSERRWSPLTRLSLIIGALAGAAAIATSLYLTFRR